MIDPRAIDRARLLLRILQRTELDAEGWARVARLVELLQYALRGRDGVAIRSAIAGLERVGALRGTLSAPAPAPRQRAAPRQPAGAPAALAAYFEATLTEVEDAAAEIRRIPHIEVDPAGPPAPGSSFTATVFLDTTAAQPGETVEAFVLRDPPDDLRELHVDVWLTASAHFAIEGPAIATVALQPQRERSTEARFTVAVRDPVPPDAGVPALRATFDFRLRASGSVRRELAIAGEPLAAPADAARTSGRMVAHGRSVPPHLAVTVNAARGRAGRYDVLVRTSRLGGLTLEDTWWLGADSEDFVGATMAAFTDPRSSPGARRRSLEGAGIAFFEAAPPRFKELYWRMVDAGEAPETMLLVSDERAVPWELMIPRRRGAGGAWDIRDALGVQCAIGRWHHDERLPPPQRIPLSDSLVLAPDYPYPLRLESAAAERDLVLAQFPGAEVPATFDALDACYAGTTASLLHFACHGHDGTLQAIDLLKDETLLAQQVFTSGLGQACRARRPLVFLNACEVGRPGVGLAGVGGFAAAFTDADAAGIVAPLWAVHDGVAHEVARAFYAMVAAEPQAGFAEILRRLRARAYGAGGADSFAAYCWYGDPRATAGAA